MSVPREQNRIGPPHEAIRARLSCVAELVCDLLQIVPAGAPGWPALRAELRSIRSYLLDHTAMAGSAARTQEAALSANGGNLAAVLAGWRDREPVAFAAFTTEALRLMPEFVAFELADREGGRVELGGRLADGGLVTTAHLSQGMLHLLAVLALSFDPAPPAVLCIEELDRGLHPRLLREVRDALYRLSHPQSFGLARKPVQVVATTQSPYLLDLFREHPEEVVISQKRGGEARFERLADRADLAELLREGSLGDLWFSGILGGVPEQE